MSAKYIMKKELHTLVWVITRVKTEWDLELLSFIPVAAVALCLLPISSQPFKIRENANYDIFVPNINFVELITYSV